MKTSLFLGITLMAMVFPLSASDAPASAEDKAADSCPVDGKKADANFSYTYEDKVYQFCNETCLDEFKQAREESLYHQIGGKAAVSAAVDLFYVKVLKDPRVNFFFEDINMMRQHNQQKAFLSAALGGPEPWTGKDMREAHKNLDLEESHFNAIAEHLVATLEELKVDPELINKVIAVVASTKDDVLNRQK